MLREYKPNNWFTESVPIPVMRFFVVAAFVWLYHVTSFGFFLICAALVDAFVCYIFGNGLHMLSCKQARMVRRDCGPIYRSINVGLVLVDIGYYVHEGFLFMAVIVSLSLLFLARSFYSNVLKV